MKKKGKTNILTKIYSYIITNKLFLTYVILAIIGSLIFMKNTVGEPFNIKSFVPELSLILLLGAFGYLFRPKRRNVYYFFLIIFYTILFVVNCVYYKFYASFASFGELATLSQVETVTGSIWEKVTWLDFIYIFMPIVFIIIHSILKKSSYYDYITKIERNFVLFFCTILIGAGLMGARFAFATKNDYSSLKKQWNRSSVVNRFGIILYQGNDLVQTLMPKFSSLFGYDDAVKVFKNYFNTYKTEEDTTNSYTGLFEGMNVVFVHMEGQQTLLMDQTFKDGELTPNLNRLASEGTMFNNFYPQISTGTSSDSEFTLLTSLMPAASGTIFVSYYDRTYISTPSILTERGYYTFSMHGNNATMWNRNKAHMSLGYQEMYFKESYTFTDDDVINLGINDKLFFQEALPIIEGIEEEHTNYMGSIITLSNHSPFSSLDKYGEFDLTKEYTIVNEDGEEEVKELNYLEGTSVGDYFHSAHYADAALGEFLDYVENSEHFNNTVFVFYGDHDVKLGKSKIEMLYNYDMENNKVYEEGEEGYDEFDSFDYELSKNTPLIIWTKNKKIQSKLPSEVNTVTGMYDVMPTLANLMNFNNPYALGHDIFNTLDDNIIVFPNGNFLTNYVYYIASSGKYKILREDAVLDEDYINSRVTYTEDLLNVSNAIVVYDLLREDHLKDIEEVEIIEPVE